MISLLSLALAGAPAEMPLPDNGEILPMYQHHIQWVGAWQSQDLYARAGQGAYQDGRVDPALWDELRIETDGWWVLPEDGAAAVPAQVTAVRFEKPGECGGYIGIAVTLDGPPAIAAFRGAPPASWHEPAVGPDMDLAVQLDAWLEHTHTEYLDTRTRFVSYAASGDTAVVRVSDELHTDEEVPGAFGYPTLETDLRFHDGAIVEIARRQYHQFGGTAQVQQLRDVNGDGVLDIVQGSCRRVIVSVDGSWSVREPQSICCGC